MDQDKKITKLFDNLNNDALINLLQQAQDTRGGDMFTCKDLMLILKDTLRKVKAVVNSDQAKLYEPMLVITLNNAKDLCSKATVGGNAMDDWLNMLAINTEIENILSDILSSTQSDTIKEFASSREFKNGRRVGTLPDNTSVLTPVNLLRLNSCYSSIISVGKPKTDVDVLQPADTPNLTQIKYSGDYLDTAELVIAIQIIKGLIKDNDKILQGTQALKEMQMALKFVNDIYQIDDNALTSGRKHK